MIALKFAYLGQNYNGFEHHANNATPLPTIEEELWKALNKARLIFPTPNPSLHHEAVNWEGCEYSKCGRTDRGVSAFGQVVGIRVRSNRPLSGPSPSQGSDSLTSSNVKEQNSQLELESLPLESTLSASSEEKRTAHATSLNDNTLDFHPIHDEIPYCQVLNRLLPSGIRILAWCPAPPQDFSARFSCKERRYEYFFTQPAFTPTVGSDRPAKGLSQDHGRSRREGWLDIEAMRTAAKKFEGLHDFRNFCKLDASKQIENFERRIFFSDIQALDPGQYPSSYVNQPAFAQAPSSTKQYDPSPASSHTTPTAPTIYVFRLNGSAFLWHQVRHMVSILFLIGQNLEPPSLVDDLLDISRTPCKPQYEMAEDAPLVLRDCIFPREGSNSNEDALEWIFVGEDDGHEQGHSTADIRPGKGKYGLGGVVDEMWRLWRGRKIDEILAGSLLNAVVIQGKSGSQTSEGRNGPEMSSVTPRGSQRVFQGGDASRLAGKYVPVMQKPRMESIEVINRRYAKKKQFEENEATRHDGFKTLAKDVDNGSAS